uniref:Uncharacterized protein n=1 Tax=Siphoviridae sp. ctX581 TaxID=2826365 RepID=A0A8S5ME57_9CAUD|nr:MAG TPA: hypothetical protein [Siphoviridae sp. ctX581]
MLFINFWIVFYHIRLNPLKIRQKNIFKKY